jgi:hypothetical protein
MEEFKDYIHWDVAITFQIMSFKFVRKHIDLINEARIKNGKFPLETTSEKLRYYKKQKILKNKRKDKKTKYL